MSDRKLQWQRLAARALRENGDLRDAWDRLNDARLGLPFLTADALGIALDAFGSGEEVLVVGRDGTGRTVAMALIAPTGRLRWNTFQPSQLPLGAWVAEPGLRLDDLARDLVCSQALGLCLALSILQVDPLAAERGDDTSDARHDDYIATSWLEVTGSFEDYWAARGKNLRQNARKQRNKLVAEGIDARMRVLREANEMAPAIARYGTLESTGWKAAQGTAIHPDNVQGVYYTALLEGAARKGQAYVTEYLFGDRTVAMNLGLLRAGTLVVLKTAYDESIQKTLSPASLLREDELQLFFSGEEVRRIEYYGRTMDWHTKLTDRQRTLYHQTMYRWPVVKWLAERRRAAPATGETSAEATAAAAE